ncbi:MULTISPECIES: CD225/dispanin family protein [Pseudofrankia]|uniref:CD225/dispanin family protein n=1 Tax=Pseudofrankia TaxID=2994363 RepID=UPI000234C5EF|nr:MULTISPECIES: CD225/dispanin family protein [Pseudofrankia]OHV35581.1 hypothetical protein BCD49_21440 [Pseudofrankia sp. EUN1h]
MTTPPPYGTPGQDPYGQQPGYGYGTPPPGYGQPAGGYGYPPATGGYGTPPPGGYGTPIPNYLWQSVVVTLLCCLPAGIIAIVFASRVSTRQAMGDIQGALEASKKARTWCIVSAVAAVVSYVLIIIFWFALLGAALSSNNS